MKKNGNSNGYDIFGYVILSVIIFILLGCLLGLFCSRRKRVSLENFQSCVLDKNFEDPNYKNNRFFKYDNIGNLLPTDPAHVSPRVVENALMNHDEYNNAFGGMENSCLKKKHL